ncbi:5'-methylthioadenosine/S-adenosylhomocysteine nucleosidase [Herbiconiux sp.]|uniref:5'-methylthioadenosine/S-adenosylhomocysteine nucleosidase n=1 Tax=Herbiconiux sp. TaxID=1871186 RepID=UPI0025B9A85B|nr:5'-methylthioadenosine/S-adenosylhomocysteine nucleosidase [Herbiconiux sp.]
MTSQAVLVVVAMAEEAAPFLARADHTTEPVKSGEATERWLAIDGLQVLLVQSGIGFVNAAAATARALLRIVDETGADAAVVVSAGTAGGLGTDVGVGDVVIGSEYINIDADARAFGYPRGQVPGMPARHEASPRLLELAGEVWPDGAVAASGGSVRIGPIGSSYAFIAAERAALARVDFPMLDAVDMESSAIAQVCRSHGVGFASVRGISDGATDEAAADFLENTPDTAARSAEVALELVKRFVGGE